MPVQQRDRTQQQLEKAIEHLQRGNLVRARNLADEVLGKTPGHVGALRVAGHVAGAQGNDARALELLVRAAQRDPSDLPTLDAVATYAERLGQPKVAQEVLERAVVLDPTGSDRYHRLGWLCFAQGRADQAREYLLLAVRFGPEDAPSWETLATVLSHLDRLDEALEAYERAIGLDASRVRARVQAAYVLDQLGRSDEARRHREHAVAIAPADPVVAFQSSGLRRYEAGDGQIEALESALQGGSIIPDEQTMAYLALAKMYDDAGQPAEAARCARSGNDLRAEQLARRGKRYLIDREQALIDAIVDRCSPVLDLPTPGDLDAPRNLLLAGLPRSGKSLLEHRLAAHPAVRGVGERWHAARVLSLLEELTGHGYPDGLGHLDADGVEVLRETFAELGRTAVADGGSVVVSASPINIEAAGLLLLLDPRTVVVSCEREPRDLALANYLQWFPTSHPYTYEPAAMAHRLHSVRRLMQLWRDRWPANVVSVHYEDLVAEPRAVVEQVLAVVGLDPDPISPLEFATDTKGASASPTDKPHAGSPLHPEHVGMWRRWAEHLPELFAELDDERQVVGAADTHWS